MCVDVLWGSGADLGNARDSLLALFRLVDLRAPPRVYILGEAPPDERNLAHARDRRLHLARARTLVIGHTLAMGAQPPHATNAWKGDTGAATTIR